MNLKQWWKNLFTKEEPCIRPMAQELYDAIVCGSVTLTYARTLSDITLYTTNGSFNLYGDTVNKTLNTRDDIFNKDEEKILYKALIIATENKKNKGKLEQEQAITELLSKT